MKKQGKRVKISKLFFFFVMTIFFMGEYCMLEAAQSSDAEFFDDDNMVVIEEKDVKKLQSVDLVVACKTSSKKKIKLMERHDQEPENHQEDDKESKSLVSLEAESNELDTKGCAVQSQVSYQIVAAALLKKFIEGKEQLNTEEIRLLKQGLAYATELDLSSYPLITDQLLQKIIQQTTPILGKIPVLLRINLSGCYKITDAAIENLVTKCPNLQVINVQGCSSLSPQVLRHIADHCSNLQHLEFFSYDVGHIASEKAKCLTAHCDYLVTKCRKINYSVKNHVTGSNDSLIIHCTFSHRAIIS